MPVRFPNIESRVGICCLRDKSRPVVNSTGSSSADAGSDSSRRGKRGEARRDDGTEGGVEGEGWDAGTTRDFNANHSATCSSVGGALSACTSVQNLNKFSEKYGN